MWNKTIPTDLPGTVRKIRGDVLLGSNFGSMDNMFNGGQIAWALSLKTGQEGNLLFKKDYPVTGNLTIGIRDADPEVFVVAAKETVQWYGYSMTTGEKLWGPTEPQPMLDWVGFAETWWPDVIADGKLYSGSFSGVMHCYDTKTGDLLWTYTAKDKYSEATMGPNWCLGVQFIADGKIYVQNYEHSTFNPVMRGSPTICLNATTGEEIWQIPIRSGREFMAICADGIMVTQNTYDMNSYAISKGPSAITVAAPDTAISLGSSVLVQGKVTDISPGTKETDLSLRFPAGVPAVSDQSMSEWMQYVYMQFPRPQNVIGVNVVLSVLDSNNNTYEIGRTTADQDGMFRLKFTPQISGEYTVIATFEGSNSYWPSHTETFVNVEEVPQPTSNAETVLALPPTEIYFAISTIAIIIAIAVAVVLIRKRSVKNQIKIIFPLF